MSSVNPAYATSDNGTFNFGGIFRTQWLNTVGSPTTANIFAHTPLSDKIEIGFNAIHDQLGDGVLQETTVNADIAYVIKLNIWGDKLSFGLKPGINLFNTNFNGFKLNDAAIGADNAFQNTSQTFFNLGAGAFLFSNKYYLGLSVPNFMPNKHLKEQSGFRSIGIDEMHVFFTGGYVFKLTQNVKFKPAFMTKFVKDTPLSADITANFLFNDKFEIGAAHRINDSFSGLVNFKIRPNLRVGYAYDYTISNLGQFNSGSHELFILFDLIPLSKRGYDKSPRFF